MKRSSARLGRPKTRGRNKPKAITDVRKLVSRKEAAEILGCHSDTAKKLEKRNGGPLTVIRLHPKGRTVFYRLEEVMRLVSPTAEAA